MLGVMAEISMDLVGHLFGGAAAGKFVATVIGEGGTTGIMETVTQQLGLGLMLSTLLITVPPMAGMWFNGVMGSFSAYSVIGNGNRQEVPPHLDGGASRQINYNAQNRASNAADNDNYDSSQRNLWTTGGIQQTGSTTTDAMKQLGQPGKGSNPS
ncbi:VirB6 protein [Neisseria flavescens]|nr:VirB6 protein [Neisseria flavescens]